VKCTLYLMLVGSIFSLTWSCQSLAQDAFRLQCLTWVHEESYPTGKDEIRCQGRFDLPTPFTLKCVKGIASKTALDADEQLACRRQLLSMIKRKFRDFLTAE